MVLKAVRGGYDGRGVWLLDGPDPGFVAQLLAAGTPLMAEQAVTMRRELAVQVARSPYGQAAAWPVVETVQRDGQCVEVLAPAPGLSAGTAAAAQQLALRIAEHLDVTGLLAVELFDTDGTAAGLMVNELAMRPHNSGHWTIEGARTSQFEQHLRAVLDYPLGSTEPTAPVAVMANVLGAAAPVAMSLDERVHHLFARFPDVKVHLYGKAERPARKVGHVTVLGDRLDEVRARAVLAAGWLVDGRVGRRVVAVRRRRPRDPISREGRCPVPDPLVGVIMGSDSDWPVMSAAAEALAEFAVPYEVGVYSAHRTPQRMLDYATSAAGRGLRVIVAGAGGAAHLPGMVAAATPLPVIGVPVPLKVLDGLDSLLSIVQMPAGVPVATVAVGGARNAGLLAVRILATADEGLRARMQAFQASLQATVLEKDAALRRHAGG